MKKTLVIALTVCMTGLVAFAADEEKKEKRAEKARAKALEKFDKNGDGKLDESEKEAARKDRKGEANTRALKKFDKNGDGKLDDSEREAAKAERRKAAENKKPADEKKDK